MAWDPTGILQDNVKLDQELPQYNFAGQTIQWGEMFAGVNQQPGYTDSHFQDVFVKNGQPFDALQWALDQYGVENMPQQTTVLFFNDSGPCLDADSIFCIKIEYYNGKYWFGAGFHRGANVSDSGTSLFNPWADLWVITANLYGYTGCDINNIKEIDHQMSRCYFYRHTTLSPDGTDVSNTIGGNAAKSYMIYNMKDGNGNPAPLTGPHTNIGKYVDDGSLAIIGDGWVPNYIMQAMYTGYPSAVSFSWGNGSLPASMYGIIDNFLDEHAEIGGGNGIYGNDSDSIGPWDVPNVGFEDIGFVRMFTPTKTQLQLLYSYLWTDDVIDNLKKMFSTNPLDLIISLAAVPLNLASVRGNAVLVHLGADESDPGVSLSPLTSTYLKVYMGRVNVVENWGNCLDYDPFTEFDVFLPFVGYRQLDANDVVGPSEKGGCNIDLYYYVNLLTGEFIAAGFSSARHPDNCIFQYAGSFNFTCPITAPNYSAYYKNVLAGAANIVSSAASGAAGGGILGGIAGAVGGAASAALNSAGSKAVERSGSLSGGSAVMGCMVPYIIQHKPVQHLDSAGYKKLEGFPSYVNRKLSTVTGFCIVDAVKMDGFTGTKEEARELEEILKGGVYL